jgi:hypothetical protein
MFPDKGATGQEAKDLDRSAPAEAGSSEEVSDYQGRHSPNVSTILLRFFYDFSTIIPRAHFPAFPR